MSVQPKAPGEPEPPWWDRLFWFVALILFVAAIAAVPLMGLYAINIQIAEILR